MFDVNKYKYFTYNDKNTGAKCVSAVSTYAGRTVRGVARCDVRDNFDLETGKALAAARCNQKVAMKRVKNSARRVAEAQAWVAAAQKYLEDMKQYNADASAELTEANAKLQEFASL